MKEEVKNYPIIGKSDIITENSKIEVIKIKTNIANHYRLMWVKKAHMVNGQYSFLIRLDKKVVGILMLNGSITFGSEYAVIFSDPAAPTSKYKRLSKLIAYLCCTKTMLKTINDLTMWRHTGFTTAVITNEFVSMKYRGLFNLAKRESQKASESDYKFKLIYQNKENIFESYEDALKTWLNKHGTITAT